MFHFVLLVSIGVPLTVLGVLCVAPVVVGASYGIAWLVWAGLVASVPGLLASLYFFYRGYTYKGAGVPSMGPGIGAAVELVGGGVGLLLCGASLAGAVVWLSG
jgi:hypothetical protein